MKVRPDRCDGCLECPCYCPVGALKLDDVSGRVTVDQELCVECGTCARCGICPSDAFEAPALSWPRSVRRLFSDPLVVHEGTDVPGRGTEEMKTNEVTGCYREGVVGLSVEVGRPGLSTSFLEIQTITTACAGLSRFAPHNPLTALMDNPAQGTFPEPLLAERVLSVHVQMVVDSETLPALLEAVRRAAGQTATVCSVSISQRADPDGGLPVLGILDRLGVQIADRGKTNVGLGRPLFEPPSGD